MNSLKIKNQGKCSFFIRRFILLKVFLLFIFASSSSSVVIDCYYDTVMWSVLSDRYGCEALITNYENEKTFDEVIGTHIEERTNKDVEFFSVAGDRTLTKMPRKIQKPFPNLLGLRWLDGVLETVTAKDLKPFPKLTVLVLSQNHLVSLESGVFQNTPLLQEIYLRDNLLEHLGQDILNNLSVLSCIRLKRNKCIDFDACTPEAIEEVKLQLPEKCPLFAKRSTEQLREDL